MNGKTNPGAGPGGATGGLPSVSVVVATIGRGPLLVQTLKGLLACNYPDFEIVVVDQTPNPEPFVIRFMDQNSARIRYIRRRRPGLPDARNAGVAAARGDVILFVDDDVVPDNGLIAAHAAAYASDGVGGVAGRVLAPGGAPERTEGRPSHVAKIGLGGLLIRDNFDAAIQTDAHHVRGCNMSFLRRAVDEAGGFDGRFGGSAHLEETDLSLRVRARGHRLVFVPAAVLIHLLEPAGGCRPKNLRDWFFWFGHNSCLFYRKNFPAYLFPVFVAFLIARLPYWAVRNLKPAVMYWTMEGFIRGLETYRKEAGRRFSTTG
jgi:GT2 family glycosyltransferase